MRDATPTEDLNPASMPFLLTRLMRGATFPILPEGMIPQISTHAPHARRDHARKFGVAIEVAFLLTYLL